MGMFDQSVGFKTRQHQRDMLYRGISFLDPAKIQGTFSGLQGMLAPMINQIGAEIGMAGQMAGQSTIANLSRQGLGNTGLGAALSGALQRGSAFQGGSIRARMLQDILNQAIGIQNTKAGAFIGAGQATPISFDNFSMGGKLLAAGVDTAVQAISGGMVRSNYSGASTPTATATGSPGYNPGPQPVYG